MTRAEQVKSAYNMGEMSYTDLLEEANEIAEAYEEDYENETTYFEYSDGSVAVFDTMAFEIRVYAQRDYEEEA